MGKFPCDRYYYTSLSSTEYWIEYPPVNGDSELHSTHFCDGKFSADLQF